MRPDRYSVTFFDPRDGKAAYDGMAALFFADAERARATSGRKTPPRWPATASWTAWSSPCSDYR